MVDGSPAAAFLKTVPELIEEPAFYFKGTVSKSIRGANSPVHAIHHVDEFFATNRARDRLSDTRSESSPGVDTTRRDVTVENHVVHFQQRTVGGDWLGIDHIECRGTDVAALERGDKILCIHQRPPGRG